VLARPVLRKLVGPEAATDQENKLMAQIRTRVTNWKDLDGEAFGLFYDSSARKKKQSWGTEAVLNAVILAFDDRAQGKDSPSDTTRKAFANLWQTQIETGDERGTWAWLDFNIGPWEWKEARYFGASLAAVAVGTAPGYYTPGKNAETDARVALLCGYLKNGFPTQNLHNRAWGLWASTKLEGILTNAEQKKLIDELCGQQRDGGDWSLSLLGAWVRSDGTEQETGGDGYATGLVLHVLQTAGVPKEDVNIAKGLDWLKSNQLPSGAWRGVSVNKKRDPASHSGKFMSDAATGFALLALSH
jgi:squalene-hopene/tetraprenyl-beta-curcumene cyclase